ncbi:MAG: hypothetical protein OXH73_00515 [Caldilineaceae bacterium]|nr:hypothetical protein [Caldilineaceae bacterium]
MSPFSSGLPGVLQDAGLVLGLVISLTIGSYLIRDNFLARLGQYVLIGAGLGYLAVLVWRNVLWPRLFAPLLADPMSWQSATASDLFSLWLPLLLGVLMWGGGLELLRPPPDRLRGRILLRLLAAVPAAILGGVVLGVAVSGAVQGTLWPLLAAAFQLPQAEAVAATGGPPSAGQAAWPVRLLTLLITGGVLIHLQYGPIAGEKENGASSPRASSPVEADAGAAGRPNLYRMLIRTLLRVWEGIGRRALWLAAGIIFARLVASRFSLALARLDYFLFEVPRSDLWQLLWAALRGGGS